MKTNRLAIMMIVGIIVFALANPAQADKFSDTIAVFKKSEAVQPFFKNAYGYAVFPTVGKAGIGIGGSYGTGQVYRGGKVTGETSLIKATIGFQLGGQAFSQMIFFEDKRHPPWPSPQACRPRPAPKVPRPAQAPVRLPVSRPKPAIIKAWLCSPTPKVA